MCRNIKTLLNFEPPATEQEIRAAWLQFVRKLSGFAAPSKANEAACQRAVEHVAASVANFSEAIEVASNHDGDSDSTASISGQLYGAKHGLAALPASAIDSSGRSRKGPCRWL
jgi:hypothetical protein